MRAVAIVGLTWWLGCGGATSAPSAPVERDWAGEASRALHAGRLDEARAAAERALDDAARDDVRELAAAVALARGEYERAAEILAGADAPRLVTMRARARYALGDGPGALADLVALRAGAAAPGHEDAEPDVWATAARSVLRDVGARALFTCYGSEQTTLAMEGDGHLPLIEVEIDGVSTLALIATGTDFTIVDSAIRAEGGVIDRLELGAIRVEGVPAFTHELDAFSAEIGARVGAVLGLDVVRRLTFTFDFAASEVIIQRTPKVAPPSASSIELATLGGSHLAVYGQLDTVDGWLLLNMGEPFAIALTDDTVRDLGLEAERLELLSTEPVSTAPAGEAPLRVTTIRRLRLGRASIASASIATASIASASIATASIASVAIANVPALTGLPPVHLEHIVDLPVAATVGSMTFAGRRVTIDGPRLRMYVE